MVLTVWQRCLIILMGVSTCQTILQSSPLAFFPHHSWSIIVPYCKQIADCNVFLLNVQLSSGVHLGIACCQYSSFPQPYSSLEPLRSKVQCFSVAGNYQDCVYSTWLSTIVAVWELEGTTVMK